MSTFAENRRLALPVMLRGTEGRSWATALGGAQDEEAARLRVAGLARSLVKAPDDALNDIGSMYALPRSPRETNTDNDYRTRMQRQAWTFWEQAPQLSGLAEIGYPYTRSDNGQLGSVLEWHNAYEGWLNVSPANFSSCFGLLWGIDIQADTTWDASPGDAWDDGGIWEVLYDPANPYTAPSFGVADLDYFKRQIRAAKGAGAYPTALVLSTRAGTGIYDMLPGVWDEPAIWDDVAPDAWEDTLAAVFGGATVIVIWLGHVWGEEDYSGGGPGVWGAADGATWDDFEPPTGGW